MQCMPPYELIGGKCDSYGVVSFSADVVSAVEGECVEVKVVREFGSVGRVVLKVYSSSIENLEELRGKEESYVERKSADIEFLDGEAMKTFTVKTYKDTRSESQPKRLKLFVEHKEGVAVSIPRNFCIIRIYDSYTADSHHSYGFVSGHEDSLEISGLLSGQPYEGRIHAFIEDGVKKTDGTDLFLTIVEQNKDSNFIVSSITPATYNSDNLYDFSFTLPMQGEYRATLCVCVKGVKAEYYRNMAFAETALARVEDYFPRKFAKETPLISVAVSTVVRVDIGGEYALHVSGATDDCFKLWVDGELVMEFRQAKTEAVCSTAETTATLQFSQNTYHLLRLNYVHGPGEPCINVQWTLPGTSEPTDIPFDQLHAAETIRYSPYLLRSQ